MSYIITDHAIAELEAQRDRAAIRAELLEELDEVRAGVVCRATGKVEGLNIALGIVRRHFVDSEETVTCRCRYGLESGERFQAFGPCKVHPVEGRILRKGLDSTSELG